jgi:hypothetical protein
VDRIAWAIGEEEEAMIVGTIQQGDNSSWQEASSSWLEPDGEEESEAYCVGTCQGASSQPPEAGGKRSSRASGSPEEEEEDEEIMKDGWWTPDLRELQIEAGEKGVLHRAPHERLGIRWGRSCIGGATRGQQHDGSSRQKGGSFSTGGPEPRKGPGK